MASEAKCIGLQYLRLVQTKLQENDPETYEKFIHVLKQFRIRNLPSFAAVQIISKLLHNHLDLLLDFKPLISPNYAAAAAAASKEADNCRASAVDFLKRIEARFSSDNNGPMYKEFLVCLDSYARGKLSISEVRDRVVGLFAGHQDLAAEFVSFLPESCDVDDVQRKRKLNNTHAADEEIRASEPITKRRNRGEKEKSRVRAVADVEDSLVHVEVQISQLESTLANARELTRRLASGELSARAVVRLQDHFRTLDLACIRKQRRRFVVDDEIRVDDIPRLMDCLVKKKETLDKSKLELRSKMRESLLHIHSL